MRKFLAIVFTVILSTGAALAQGGQTASQAGGEIPNMGRAPKEPNGIGRLDLRVVDEDGNPVEGVRAELKSNRTDGFTCESWNSTDARGVAVLPPLHMGRLSLKLKAKGFQTQTVQINASDLDQPVRVTLARKN
ncbi:MAG TPA: carboxypeptidase-like regulatory domain-containing protein [Pyrinomonadaceae bacterium]|nr:carboxypeptidase-like regulatory domain-containing protein [Pyrinomonadaceae bacterium]